MSNGLAELSFFELDDYILSIIYLFGPIMISSFMDSFGAEIVIWVLTWLLKVLSFLLTGI